MIDNKPFAMFFNASPRKGWNTYKMLEAAKAGAEEAGAITELVNLYDIKFPGCKSCFACKLKNAKTNGVCAIRDELRPILERARQASEWRFVHQASEQGPFWQPPGQAITSWKLTGILPAAYSFTIAHVLRSMPLICFASSLKPGIFEVASVNTASVTPQLRA